MIDTVLLPYQIEGANWLAPKTKALLADEMGLGKTAQVITAISQTDIQDVLVVCPAIARSVWHSEKADFATRDFKLTAYSFNTTFIPRGRKRKQAVTVNPILSRHWPLLVIDECHMLANAATQSTQAVYGYLAKRAQRVWCVSGTPARNHAGNLYTLLRMFGLIQMTYADFETRYLITKQTPYGTQVLGQRRVEELRAILAPYILRRRKDDVLPQLPPITFSHVMVEAGPVDMQRYWPEIDIGMTREETVMDEIERQQAAIDAVMGIVSVCGDGANALEALQRRTTATRRYVGLQKCQAVFDTIHYELQHDAYDKIVIFCYHSDVMEDLIDRFRAHYEIVSVWGATREKDRVMAEKKFQTYKRVRVFLGNILAAGVAITLTAASECAFVECSWVPSDNAQAAMRIHRIGQTRPVRVRMFGLAGTTDEKVTRVLKRKTKDLVDLFDAPEEIDLFEE